MLLPALFLQPQHDGGPQMAQTAAIIGRTVAEGFETLRADRALEREAAANQKSFSEVFPANAIGIRRLCQAGNDDDILPEFWRFLALVKGKKAPGLSALINYVTIRANAADSSGVLPIISTPLYTNILAFELGASDLETITQGVSPFLMCPTGYVKAKEATTVTQKYLLLQGENNLPLLSDIQQLVPSNHYSLPDDLHSLVDFVGAYSVVWDVLVGEFHPLAISLRNHYKFWNKCARSSKLFPNDTLRTL